MTIPKIVLYLKKVYNYKLRPLFTTSGNYNSDAMKASSEFIPGCLDAEAAKEDQVPIVSYSTLSPSKQEEEERAQAAAPIHCAFVMLALLVMAFVACGVMLYQQYTRPPPRLFAGYCTIPIQQQSVRDYNELMNNQNQAETIDPTLVDQRVIPLHWSETPDVRVFTIEGDETQDASLHEEFDIGGQLESIRVFDNGRTITFIHDFVDNVTGIVDEERCFMMDLDPFVVLPPEVLVLGMRRGASFDISRVRSTLRALLPALQDLVESARALAAHCQDKPTYQLEKDTSGIRKRSVDAPPHDYMQFAGRHVQEIEIANLADVLTAEQQHKR